MRIRLATADDGPKLWALAEEYIASQVALGSSDDRKALALAFKHGVETGEAIIVAEDAGELVGFVAWTAFPASAEGRVEGMGTYVRPSHRDLGLSKSLRSYAQAHCRAKGYREVIGMVLVNNEPGKQAAASSNAEIVGYVLRWRL